jgi:hypothetical protein
MILEKTMRLMGCGILVTCLAITGCQQQMNKADWAVRMMLASSTREGEQAREAELVDLLWDQDVPTRKSAIVHVAWTFQNRPLPARARDQLIALQSDLAVSWEAKKAVKDLGLESESRAQ